MTVDVTIGLAFLAGLISFISPCVLPLVPAYVSYMGARATKQAAAEVTVSGGVGTLAMPFNGGARARQVVHGLFFVLGFSAVFVGFGLLVNAGIDLFHISSFDLQNTIARVGGILIILLGLQVMGVWGWILSRLRVISLRGDEPSPLTTAIDRVTGLLYADTRQQVDPRNPYGYAGSALMGVVFAAGWTPCVGPIYGAIISLVVGGTLARGAFLLMAYSLGLGLPFLLMTLAVEPAQKLIKRLQRYMRLIELVSGVFLIAVGYLLVSNQMTMLTARSASLSDFSYNLEQCGTGIFDNQVPVSDFGKCMSLGVNYQFLNSTGPDLFGTPTANTGTISPPAAQPNG